MLTVRARLRHRAVLGIVWLAPLAGSGCDLPTEAHQSSSNTPIAELVISPGDYVVGIGERVRFSALFWGSNPASSVEWISTDPQVAIIAPDGTLEGIKDGLTYVIAVAGRARSALEVTVGTGDPRGPGQRRLK